MDTTDLNSANYETIMSGLLSGAELVIGLVGPVGTNLGCIVRDLTKCLEKYDYISQEIHVSELISGIVEIPPYKQDNAYERTNALMTAGDLARENTRNNSILALAVVSQINGNREVVGDKPQPQPRHAYIINSLKHPDEVNALRRIYGNAFFLLGVYVNPTDRKHNLCNSKLMSEGEAKQLMSRDEEEGPKHGQRTRSTFHLSDLFVHLEDGDEGKVKKTQATLERFLDIIFADPYRTPLFDEYAMFMAFASAVSSADLSRQIGAVIAKDNAILASGANDCPCSGGGTYWPFYDAEGNVVDVSNGRDYMHGRDQNDEEKARIVKNALEAIKKAWEIKKDEMPEWGEEVETLLKNALASSTIDDITEYGRVVHAEMNALLTCARNNISCKRADLYSTTFPCHNCAKHIIAAGITRVVYVEPYPKSKALEFHEDSAFAGFRERQPENTHVAFEPFVGVGPRRFFDLFSMKEGSGFPLKRKDKSTGKKLNWEPANGTIRMPELPWSYLDREEIAIAIMKQHWKGTDNDKQG